MKNFKIKTLFVSVVLMMFFTSCSNEAGTTRIKLNGNEKTLPDELKGLKVYDVSIGGGNYIKVALMDNVNSTTYRVGKHESGTTIVVNRPKGKLIEVREVVMENDSMIVCKK